MRAIAPVTLLLTLGACGVDNDPANEKVTVTYDRERIEKAGRAAKDAAVSAGNVAETTGKAIKKEIGDVDVDVKVTRDKGEASPAPAQ
jgi:hypothetical protein